MQSVYALASNNFISSGNKYGVEVDDDADGSDIDGDDYNPSQQAPKMKKANEPAWTIKQGWFNFKSKSIASSAKSLQLP